MSWNTEPLNQDKEATELWLAKGEDLSNHTIGNVDEDLRPKLYTRKNYNHNTIHIHNPNGASIDIWICNYNPMDLNVAAPETHFQQLVPTIFNSLRVVTFGKAGFIYIIQNTAGKVWAHVLSGQREQR
jgi:hypothetical protein